MTEEQRRVRVFVENERGSDIKHHYNEDTFEVARTERVGANYPYPYGFVPGTLAPDGDAVDCFILTEEDFGSGTFVECEPIALLEQTEAGDIDHNVLAVIPGQLPDLTEALRNIVNFIEVFRADCPDQDAVVGRLLPAEAAMAYVSEYTGRPGN